MFRTFLLSALMASFSAVAQESPATADSVLEKLCGYFQSQPAFSLVETISLDVTGPVTSHDEVTTAIDMQRPNLMKTSQSLKAFQVQSVNNSDGMFLHLVEPRQVKVEPAKPTLAAALDAIAGSPMGSDVRFLVYLLDDDPLAAIKSRMASIEYVGQETIEGVSCHHLRLDEEELRWDIWVQDGDTPLLKRIVPDLTKYMDARRQQVGADTQASMKIDIAWNHPADFSGDHFKFETPANALRVREFQPFRPNMPQFDLLANPAPPLKANTLGGESVALEPQDGEVWIVDFWAIWCQPCHMLMPVVQKVAEDYKSKGVRLYSVNVGDNPQQVSSFLEKKDFDTAHALSDPGQQLASAYRLESFPMVVLIGQDGTVQTIRSGFGPGYEQQLRKDLDVLTSGESLIARPAS